MGEGWGATVVVDSLVEETMIIISLVILRCQCDDGDVLCCRTLLDSLTDLTTTKQQREPPQKSVKKNCDDKKKSSHRLMLIVIVRSIGIRPRAFYVLFGLHPLFVSEISLMQQSNEHKKNQLRGNRKPFMMMAIKILSAIIRIVKIYR